MDLWVLPPPLHSKWFSRLDWYLNWQLCKGLAFERAKPSVELFRILDESDYKFTNVPAVGASPLLVMSRGRVPAAKVLVLETRTTLKDWLVEIHRICSDLKAESVRIFLPLESETAEAAKLWANLPSLTAQFSSDEDAL